MNQLDTIEAAEASEQTTEVEERGIPSGMVAARGTMTPSSTPPDDVMDMDAIFDKVDQDEQNEHDDGEEDEFVDPDKHMAFELTLRTGDAQGGWVGKAPTKGNKGFPGIEWFVRKCGRICRAVREDDPYAMMALQDIEHQLRTMRSNFKLFLDESDQLLKSGNDDGLVYKGPSKYKYDEQVFATEPRNGYAFAAVQLAGRFDRVVMNSHQARDMGLISSKRFSEMKNRKPFRALTWSLARFKNSGTTREDFRQGTQRAKEAVEKYGMVAEEVMNDDFALLLMEVRGPAAAKTVPLGEVTVELAE